MWILIVFMYTGAWGTTSTFEFKTQKLCSAAQSALFDGVDKKMAPNWISACVER